MMTGEIKTGGQTVAPSPSTDAISETDAGCICRGNWRQIITEVEPLLGRRFRDKDGKEYVFFGVVHTEDDYCYGFCGNGQTVLLSCVGSIESQGYALIETSTSGRTRARPEVTVPVSRTEAAGIPCVHCNGKGVEEQHYDERIGWSAPDMPCATCGGAKRIYTVEQYLKTLPADWHQDSSLKTWFPLLAEEFERLKAENAALKEKRRCSKHDIKDCPDCRAEDAFWCPVHGPKLKPGEPCTYCTTEPVAVHRRSTIAESWGW